MNSYKMLQKINRKSERQRDFLNEGAPLINIHSKESSGSPCPCQSLDGPIVRFYSPITGKIYIRTFSAGGARIPVNVGVGHTVPRSMMEIKDLLQVHKAPRTPLHLPSLPSEPSIQDRLRNQAEFYNVYNSTRKKGEAENQDESKKLPPLVQPCHKNTTPGCSHTSWKSTLETPKQPSVQKIPRLKVCDRYRKPTLEDKGISPEETTGINQPTNNMLQVKSHPKLPPLVNKRNDWNVDQKLLEWREKVRKCNRPLDEDSPLPSKGRIPKEMPAPEIVTKVIKHEYNKSAETIEGKSTNLLIRIKPDVQSTVDKPKNTRLLWKHEVDADSPDDIESDCDFASRARISDITICASSTEIFRVPPSDSVNPKNKKIPPSLPNIFESPSKLKQRSREQFRKANVEASRETLRSLSSMKQIQMKKNRLQKSMDKEPESEEDPAILIKKAIKKMKSTSWNESAKGLEETVQLSNVAPHLLEPYMNTVYRHLIQLLRSLRSTVVRIACNVARELFRTMKCVLRPEFDEIGGILVYKTADTNRFIREDANCALDEMITHIPALNTIRVLVDKGASHKNALVRIAVARLLTCVVALTGAENILGPRGPKETRKRLLQTIAKFMDDCSLETRDYARNLYKQLLEYEEFEYHFHNDVDNDTLRRIEKTMIKLKYDNDSAFEEDE